MEALSVSQQYPAQQYNLLGNTDVIANIPDIKSPVIQVIRLNTTEGAGDVYIQTKANREWTDRGGKYHPATPDLYAITKNGLKKLADGAGIKMISSEHVVPTTCQKCVAVNANSGKTVKCGECSNQDVAYKVTISVPQLTGEILTVEDTHEIIVANTVAGMSDKQRIEFMRHLPQICEAKALNGAIRTALHIKGTYTLEELRKPFVVAYLVPNLNNKEVKQAAINSMFESQLRLFGSTPPPATPTIQQIESKVPETHAIEASDGENYDQYVDGTYEEVQEAPQRQPEPQTRPSPQRQTAPVPAQPHQAQSRPEDFCCDMCGRVIKETVWDYSMQHFNQPLCMDCQRKVRNRG